MKKDVLTAGFFILLAILSFNVYLTTNAYLQVLASKPTKITISVISCEGCPYPERAVSSVLALNVKADVKNLTRVSDEFLEKYGITKLPAVVITGETDKISLSGFSRVDDAYVLNGAAVPYYDIKTGEMKGLVKATVYMPSNCPFCRDFSSLIQNLQSAGVVFSEIRSVDYRSGASELGISRVPAIVLSKDIEYYPFFGQISRFFNKSGEVYFLESPPPYVEVASGKIRGLVELTEIVPDSCDTCYNVSLHEQILERIYGVYISSKKLVKVSDPEGKKLIEKYNITWVPTIVLKGDVDVYEELDKVWKNVGTVESDGAYVFRNHEVIKRYGAYLNLTTGVVEG